MKSRIEKDTMGMVQVPADKYWGGSQTQRSIRNLPIDPTASMPIEIHAFAYLKEEQFDEMDCSSFNDWPI